VFDAKLELITTKALGLRARGISCSKKPCYLKAMHAETSEYKRKITNELFTFSKFPRVFGFRTVVHKGRHGSRMVTADNDSIITGDITCDETELTEVV